MIELRTRGSWVRILPGAPLSPVMTRGWKLPSNRRLFNQHQCGTFAGIVCAYPVRGVNQVLQLRVRVMRRDASRSMSQQVLPILKRHPGCTQPAPEGVLQIMHPHLRQTSSLPRAAEELAKEARERLRQHDITYQRSLIVLKACQERQQWLASHRTYLASSYAASSW